MSIAQDTDDTPDVELDLRDAADHVERYGLHKGEFFSPDNGMCACTLGAIAIVTTPADQDCDADLVDCEPAAVTFLEYLAATEPNLVLRLHDGAVAVVAGGDAFFSPAGVNLIETVGAWNDAPERTAEQVAETLRAAARWAGEQR